MGMKRNQIEPPQRGQTGVSPLCTPAWGYAQQAKAPNTIRAYQSDWRAFTAWCAGKGLQALPATPETVAHYLASLARAGAKTATIARKLASLSQAHKTAGYDSPTSHILVRTTWAGIRRELGTAQAGKSAVLTRDIRAMVQTLPANLRGLRDRALLLMGFAGALRRSELVSLDVADVAFMSKGLEVRIRRSKTDPEGQGQMVAIPYGKTAATCPVRALQAWLLAANITSGPIFRAVTRYGGVRPNRLSACVVSTLVKRAAAAIGRDPANFGGHSLRAGFITAAAAEGVPEWSIMEHSRHKSVTVARRYIRRATLWQDNAASRIGL